jgi:hypothetical protein
VDEVEQRVQGRQSRDARTIFHANVSACDRVEHPRGDQPVKAVREFNHELNVLPSGAVRVNAQLLTTQGMERIEQSQDLVV